MTERTKSILAFFGILAGLIVLVWWNMRPVKAADFDMEDQAAALVNKFRPVPPPLAYRYSLYRSAPIEVAKVFGRSQGCSEADADFVREVANLAVYNGIDARVVAATIAVESGCNSFSISSRGAIGMMQIMPKVWAHKYDFEGSVNLLNRHDNLRVGTEILAGLMHDYGTVEGIRRYQGLGVGCETCDGQYTAKILNLAGRK